jgi:Na+-driven multidrug efflux pump
VATRIESLSLITMFGLSTSVAPFVGQNYGAGLTARVRRCLYDAFAFSLVWGLVMAAVLAMFAEQIAGIFTDNSNVAAIAAMYMYIVPVSFGAQGVVLIASSAFNALGKPVPSAVLTLTRMMLLYVPLAIVGKVWFGVAGVFAAAGAANFATAVWSATWAFRIAGPGGHVSPEAAQRAQNLLHEPPSGV